MTASPPLDDLPDGVLLVTADGVVAAANTAAHRITRVTDLVGRPAAQALPFQDAQGRDWWACTDVTGGLRTRSRVPEQLLHLGVGPGAVDVLLTASFVRAPDGTLRHFVVVLRDALGRERLERSRANLVSTVAHELRSPLTSVKGFTATLLAKWDRFTDDQKRLMLQTVNADADRVTRLITELLDVSRIDAGRLEVRKQVVDVVAAIRRAVAGRVAGGEDEGRYVVVETGPLPEMWVDPDKLAQVVGNLLENAVRHGAGTVTVTVGPWADGCEVTVADEGEGIPEETASRVFTRFWRGRPGRGGTGLGLYIVKGLVEAHGGTVAVGRAPSGGAAFRFVLPAGTPDFG